MNCCWFLHKIKIEKPTAIKISKNTARPSFSSKWTRRTISSDTFLISNVAIFYTSAPSVHPANRVSSFSLHFCDRLLPETPEQPRFFLLKTLAKAIRWKQGLEKAAPSSLTVSFSVIHRLPFPSLHPTLLFLWPFYFTPIAVNPARSVGGILKAALLSVFSSPSLRCGPVLMYTSHFIEVCTL